MAVGRVASARHGAESDARELIPFVGGEGTKRFREPGPEHLTLILGQPAHHHRDGPRHVERPTARSRRGRGRQIATGTCSVRTEPKPARSRSASVRCSLARLKTPGAPGSGGGMWPRSTRIITPIETHGLRSGAPHTESARAPAGAQYPARCGKRRGGVGHEHVGALAEHAVDRACVELDPLGVDHPVVDVGEPELAAAAAGDLDHALATKSVEISRPPSPSSAASLKSGLAGAGAKFEHRARRTAARAPGSATREPGSRASASCARQRSAARRHRLPELLAGAAVTLSLHPAILTAPVPTPNEAVPSCFTSWDRNRVLTPLRPPAARSSSPVINH